MSKKLTYAQQYYQKLKARRAAEKAATQNSTPIDLDRVRVLSKLFVNEDLLKVHRTNTTVDRMFSHEGGIPVGTNVMCTGDPGVGKTTLLMHTLSNLQAANPNAKCLFISAEMSKLQVFKYMKRFPEFANLETMFTSDYFGHNMQTVLEKLLNKGYDYVLIDSIVEVLDAVKEDCGWSQGQAEKWLIDLCIKNNEANNSSERYTTFLLIQQVTKNGVFVGSNKLKHITDAHMEMKRDSDRDGGGTYIIFSKNRNGAAGIRYNYRLGSSTITYDLPTEVTEGSQQAVFSLENNQELSF
jgi:predicted ATP-dependent serine protease